MPTTFFADRAEMLIPPLLWDRPRIGPVDGEKVVLLHGLGRSWRAMNPLARRLNREGYATMNLPYPSLLKPMDWIIQHVREQISSFAGDKQVHLVTHSLGGIIARILISESPPWQQGRLVMMAPPNAGSEIIDWASRHRILKTFLSPAARALATTGIPASLPTLPPELDAMVIMGNRCAIPFFKKLLGEENDGIVSTEGGRITGLRGFSIVDADHTFIQIHPEAVRRTLEFLKTGQCSA